jgi:molecular chaperone IbpA
MSNINAPIRGIPTNFSKQLSQYLVGFDDIFDTFEKVMNKSINTTPNFPPRNIIRLDENHFRIEYAVAGFAREDLIVSVERESLLVVEGKKVNKTELDPAYYLHRGIGLRDFRNEITIPEGSELAVQLINGLLIVDVSKPVKLEPEPKLIAIG